MLGYIPERDDVDNNQVDRMQKVDTSVMVGIFWGIELDGWGAELEARQDAVGGNGFLLTFDVGYNIPINYQLMLGFSVFTTYADGDGYWNVLAVGSYSRLIGDAADSPIVDDEGDPNQFLLGLTLSYDL
jgi:outer membrane protein